jgi:monovalent cation/hydrogen antiporter
VLAFILIGLQLGPIWSRLDAAVRWQYSEIAGLVLAAVILSRIGWIAIYQTSLRTLVALRPLRASETIKLPSAKSGIVISWCGMRGIVTLAAAFALPESFPYRDLILLTAFGVVLGSLVIQGLTLRPLILALRLKQDDVVAGEVARARGAAYRAALEEIDGDPSEEAELLRLEYRGVLLQAEDDPDGAITSSELPADPLRRRAIAAARNAILQLRDSEVIGDDAFHELEEELDRAELGANG